MSWKDDKYVYSVAMLQAIAANYALLYDGLPMSGHDDIRHPMSLVEYKADFDNALSGIGKGEWNGLHSFSYYRDYGRLQRVIIADVMGTPEQELTSQGLYDIARLRNYGYHLMKVYLNGGNSESEDK